MAHRSKYTAEELREAAEFLSLYGGKVDEVKRELRSHKTVSDMVDDFICKASADSNDFALKICKHFGY